LAKSAINLSRLLLHFQKQVDQLGGQLGNVLSNALGGQTGTTAQTGTAAAGRTTAGSPATAAGAANNLGIRLWELLPIDSNAFSALLSGSIAGIEAARKGETPEGRPPPLDQKAIAHSFGAFDGS